MKYPISMSFMLKYASLCCMSTYVKALSPAKVLADIDGAIEPPRFSAPSWLS